MSSPLYDLIKSIVDDLFGPICAKTIDALLHHHRVNMKGILFCIIILCSYFVLTILSKVIFIKITAMIIHIS